MLDKNPFENGYLVLYAFNKLFTMLEGSYVITGIRVFMHVSVFCIRVITHWGQDKMVASCADDIFKWDFVKENISFSTTIPLNFVPKGQIDKKWPLVQVMAWRRSGDKPLSEPTMALFTDVYMRHSASMSSRLEQFKMWYIMAYHGDWCKHCYALSHR